MIRQCRARKLPATFGAGGKQVRGAAIAVPRPAASRRRQEDESAGLEGGGGQGQQGQAETEEPCDAGNESGTGDLDGLLCLLEEDAGGPACPSKPDQAPGPAAAAAPAAPAAAGGSGGAASSSTQPADPQAGAFRVCTPPPASSVPSLITKSFLCAHLSAGVGATGQLPVSVVATTRTKKPPQKRRRKLPKYF